ncbi:uncharacterized protein [Battus philenor]|uniref:uncharacterized protein n=1 Tax=Battus philenor TaxID=42288 RepID=UPI0035CFE466
MRRNPNNSQTIFRRKARDISARRAARSQCSGGNFARESATHRRQRSRRCGTINFLGAKASTRMGDMGAVAAAAVALIALATLADSVDAINFFQYKTESVKGAACGVENKLLGPYYIPDKQCSGVLYDLPQHCARLELVKVEVTDYAHVQVHIDDALRSASVQRAPAPGGACPGRALVRVLLGCGAAGSDETSSDAAHAPSALPPH